jgi:hypothetical protein
LAKREKKSENKVSLNERIREERKDLDSTKGEKNLWVWVWVHRHKKMFPRHGKSN